MFGQQPCKALARGPDTVALDWPSLYFSEGGARLPCNHNHITMRCATSFVSAAGMQRSAAHYCMVYMAGHEQMLKAPSGSFMQKKQPSTSMQMC